MDPGKVLAQLRQNLATLGPRRLIAAAVSGLVLFAAIALGGLVVARADYKPLYVGLTAPDASRMVAVLGELGIPYETSADGTKLSVPSSSVARARGVLAERGLPAGSGAGYELFDKIGPLGLTTFMQEVSRVRALEGEISRTLNTMKGILSSRVHLVLADRSTTLRQPVQKSTASVVLKLEVAPDRAPVEAVRNVVAAAVPSLAAENVHVVSADGAVLANGGDAEKLGASKMLDLESAFSSLLKRNLTQTLSPILGSDNFQTSIAVRLSADQSTTNENIFDPASKVERSVRVVKETGNSKDDNADQTVSVERNVPQAGEAANGSRNVKSNQRRDETTSYEINSKTVSTTRDGYRIDAISVALVVNKKALKAADGQPLEDSAVAARIAEIEKVAASSVGLDSRRGDRVVVVAQNFQLDGQDGSDLQAAGLSVALQSSSSSIIAAIAIALSALAIIWFGARPLLRQILDKPAQIAFSGMPALERNASGGRTSGNEREVSQASGPSVSEEEQPISVRIAHLNELVSRDPEQAIAVVRRWIRTESAGSA